MAIIESKVPAASGPSNTNHGSVTHQRIRDLVSGKDAAKALPATRRGGHDHRLGPAASEGENAVHSVSKQVKR